MAATRRFAWLDLVLVLLVVASAGGARAGYLLSYADKGANEAPLRVQGPQPAEFDLLVSNLEKHHSFNTVAPFAKGPEETAHVSPGYPHVVALVRQWIASDKADSAIRWGQCGLGALTAGLYFLFARLAFRSLVVGLLAGLLAALHPFWIINTAEINDGVLATFLLAASLFLGARASQTGGPLSSLLFGLMLAGLALVRAALLPFGFVAIIWFLLRTRTVRRGWLAAVLGFLGFVTGLAPWTVRNVQVFGEPIPIVDSAFLHLWIGNNPAATGGPDYQDGLPFVSASDLKKIENQPKRYEALSGKVWEEAKDGPATMRRRIQAALDFFLGAEWFNTGELAQRTGPEADVPEGLARCCSTVLQAALLAMFLLGLIGWRWSYGWRWESMPAALAMVVVPLPYILGHAEMLSGPRLPLDGVMLCYVAFVLGCFMPGGGSYLREAVGAGEGMDEAP